MRALGVYFAQQKPKGLAARDPSLVKAGQRLWRGVPFPYRSRHTEELPAPRGAVRRLHVCAAEGVQGGRARRRSRRQGRQRTRNEHGRAAADGCADEGYRRLRRRTAVSRFIVSLRGAIAWLCPRSRFAVRPCTSSALAAGPYFCQLRHSRRSRRL
jgi:hypothetical protein